MDFKFLLNNIFSPDSKLKIHLGKSDISKRYLAYFNMRSIKRAGLKNKKWNCALLNLTNYLTTEEYLASVNGKNSASYFARRCSKLSYSVREFDPNEYINDIYAIHTSSKIRQGREMDASYLEKMYEWPNDSQNSWFGVFDSSGQLVGYIWLVFLNELALVNRILGHENHLKSNIMYYLTTEVVSSEIRKGLRKYMMYDTFGTVKNGLVLFKRRIGFKPTTINFVE